MATRPDFTDAQRMRLRELGCLPEQTARLRTALVAIRNVLHHQVRRNDVRDTLEEVIQHTKALTRVLEKIALPSNPARAEANRAIESAYWRAFPLDTGPDGPEPAPSSACHMLPRLRAIAEGARAASDALPPRAPRHRTAAPEPIREIDAALFARWLEGSDHGRKYPAKFRPSFVSARGNVFTDIVNVCYEAAGARAGIDHVRAIRAYATERKASRDDMTQAMGITPRKRGKSNGTSKKI